MRLPKIIFGYDLFVIAILVAIAAVYLKWDVFYAAIPDVIRLALHCAWFGSLGGTVISLKGIYDHSGRGSHQRWDDSYNLWHFGRPVSCAVAGGITYLLLLAISKDGGVNQPVVYAAAFILGTQEKRFFNFLTEVARLLVQVPDETKAPSFGLTAIQPTYGRVGEPAMLRGHGFALQAEVTVGGNPLAHVIVSTDGEAIAGLLPAHTDGAVDVAVTNPDGSHAALRGGFTYLV